MRIVFHTNEFRKIVGTNLIIVSTHNKPNYFLVLHLETLLKLRPHEIQSIHYSVENFYLPEQKINAVILTYPFDGHSPATC